MPYEEIDSVIPAHDTEESTEFFSLLAAGIESMISSTKGLCANH